MSPRAAWRLETLGFSAVYDYEAGKVDWFGAGLPREGKRSAGPYALDVTVTDVPTCRLTDRVGDVRPRVRAAGWRICPVVNDEQIVLGLLREKELDSDPEAVVELVMRPGPSTFRPNLPVGELIEYLGKFEMAEAVITSSDGKLIGLLRCVDAERSARGAKATTA
ncbi:MAG: CBS domain-containing protein [Chloroflexi bacterium]|nr:CBS domain-containing protein [Chloroflexota bacterium]